MKVTNQINQNECGLCVLKSLIQHYHHKDIPIEKLLDESNMTSQGITLYDLETLADQYGLSLESYNADIKDLVKHERKKPYVLIINNNGYNHYVIAKTLTKQTVRIWCSENGEYDIHVDQLKNIWTGIYLSVDKNPYKDDMNFNLKEKMSFINWKYLLLVNFLNVAAIVFSVIGATFMQNIIGLVINTGYMKNLFLITFVYLLNYIMQFTNGWLTKVIMQRRIFNHYQLLHRKTLRCLNNKYQEFYTKVDWSTIIGFDDYIFSISSFYNTSLNKTISDVLVVVVGFVLVGITQYQLLAVFAVAILICLITEYVRYGWLNKNLKKYKRNSIDYSNSIISWLEFKKQNQYKDKNNSLEAKLKKSFGDVKESYIESNKFNNSFEFVDNFLNVIIYLLLINFLCQFVIKQDLTFAKMTFILTLFEMTHGSTKSIYGIVSETSNLKVQKQILNNIWSVANTNNVGNLPYQKCENIYIDNYHLTSDTLISGRSGSGKTTLLKRIALLNKADDYYLDNVKSNLISHNSLRENIIYLSNENYLDESELTKSLSGIYRDEAIRIINMMGIQTLDPKQLSSGQRQVLSFLSLLNQSNKIILIDEALSNIDINLKHELLTTIKPIIASNNFLVVVDHNIHKDYFTREVMMNEQIN